jgi:hypothetical protein
MKLLTGPHAFGLISVPLNNSNVANRSERRLANEKPLPDSKKKCRAAILALVLIAVAASFSVAPVSYAIHRHLHP